VVLLVLPSFSQEHASTIEQCQADEALWGSTHIVIEYNLAEAAHATDGTPNRTEIAKLGIPELQLRMIEMYKCRDVVSMEPYQTTGAFYHDVVADRWLGFIKRHGLMASLKKEDAAGQR
jgi:hypothetical protein